MDSAFLHSYARVLLQVGVNLQPGQNLRILAEPVQREFMLIVAEEAYRLGGRFVRLEYADARLTRIQAQTLESRHLDYVPGFYAKDLQTYLDEEWSLLRLEGQEDPDILADVDKARLATMRQASSRAGHFFQQQVMTNRLTWCVAPAPTPRWARKVLGDAGGSDPAGMDPVEGLWKLFVPILRLDHSDPVAAWKEHSDHLRRRGRALNAMRLEALRFEGPGTDLTVGLMPRSRFIGGGAVSQTGITFIPNLPTEEVFTTPDARRTEGTLRCTRPVEVLGVPVEGITMEFREGLVRRCDAVRGRDALERYLTIDPNAGRAGEISLVDISSPVHRSGRVYHSILFDENAACHLALGNGYPDAIEGGEKLSEDELRALGCNVSLVHTDFMIGSPEVDVFGVTAGGRRTAILRDGSFVI